jgi:hypothetical protein
MAGAWGNAPESRHYWGVAPGTRMNMEFRKLLQHREDGYQADSNLSPIDATTSAIDDSPKEALTLSR